MTAQAFIHTHNGQPVDFDHSYGNQCVDLIQQYNKDVLHGSFLVGKTAIEVWNNCPQDIYTKILNTPTNFPQLGDIIFWKYNHTALVVAADILSLTTFDQNYPTQGYTDANGNFIGTGVCHLQQHEYTEFSHDGQPTVLGWWRPKNLPQP